MGSGRTGKAVAFPSTRRLVRGSLNREDGRTITRDATGTYTLAGPIHAYAGLTFYDLASHLAGSVMPTPADLAWLRGEEAP